MKPHTPSELQEGRSPAAKPQSLFCILLLFSLLAPYTDAHLVPITHKPSFRKFLPNERLLPYTPAQAPGTEIVLNTETDNDQDQVQACRTYQGKMFVVWHSAGKIKYKLNSYWGDLMTPVDETTLDPGAGNGTFDLPFISCIGTSTGYTYNRG